MPKIKWAQNLQKKPEPVKQDFIVDLFQTYRKARHMNRTILANRLDVVPTSVSKKLSKGSDGYTLAEIRQWTKALQIPEEEVADAIFRILIQE